ncbi:hypothetical protein AMECASPLE_011708 [Ameca splendens]|uniref:Uncharacterized protein n=1 Tax=Ameca splendens TaxID=208324 RepID=A0ABV0ZAL5_9TELE
MKEHLPPSAPAFTLPQLFHILPDYPYLQPLPFSTLPQYFGFLVYIVPCWILPLLCLFAFPLFKLSLHSFSMSCSSRAVLFLIVIPLKNGSDQEDSQWAGQERQCPRMSYLLARWTNSSNLDPE